MLKSDKLISLIQEQVAHELSNHVLYVQFASLFKAVGMIKSYEWFKHQAEEELKHYNVCIDFLNEYGIEVEIRQIEKEKLPIDINESINKDQVVKMFEAALKREIGTTKMLNDLVEESTVEKDNIVRHFAEHLLYEQLQEEDEATDRLLAARISNDLLAFDAYIGELL